MELKAKIQTSYLYCAPDWRSVSTARRSQNIDEGIIRKRIL